VGTLASALAVPGCRILEKGTNMKRLVVGTIVLSVVLGAASVAGAQQSEKPCPRSAEQFKFEVDTGTWEPSTPQGVTVTSASEDQVILQVEAGFTVTVTCVKTGRGHNVGVTVTPQSCTGPCTITITRTGGPGTGISHFVISVGAYPAQVAPAVVFAEEEAAVGAGGAAAGGAAAGGAAARGGEGALAFTGVQLAALLVLLVGLIATGITFLALGRRRRAKA
jgi:hypothetical protein